MNRFRIILALALLFIVFAMLLNSVGTVMLQSTVTFGVDKAAAVALERYKDLTVAFVSFVVASFLPMLGYRRAMMLSLVIVGAACAAMPLSPSFVTTKILFACTGASFALAKIAIYSSIGLLTADEAAHSRLTNTIEGMYMVGVLVGNWTFSAFIDRANPGDPSWLHVYWLISGCCAAVFVLLATSRLDESAAHSGGRNDSLADSTAEMTRLFVRPLVYVFLASAFLYVLIEQSFSSWLPTFNSEILKLPNATSIQFASILPAMTALGRFGAGFVLKRMPWYALLNVCVLGMAALVMAVLPLARDVAARPDAGWLNAPLAAYLIPLIGLLLAPIYPLINSVVLSSLPKPTHAAMTGLIIVFSALGGTLGSFITAHMFAAFDGIKAFYLPLVPMALLLAMLFLFKRETSRNAAA